jgi:3-oxoacyl-[acyl-carrier protein] reductase
LTSWPEPISGPALSGVALVTGGDRGIGAGIARELALAGMDVAVTGRTRADVEAVAAEVGGRSLVGDVSRREDVRGWFAELDHVDLLVNSAGVLGPQAAEWEIDPDEWWRVFEINGLGPFLCCHEAIPRMAAGGGGRIVNVTSGAAYASGGPSDGAYGPSKAAIHRFSEILATQARPLAAYSSSRSAPDALCLVAGPRPSPRGGDDARNGAALARLPRRGP